MADILIYIDHHGGEPVPASWEAVGAGVALSAELGAKLRAVVIGDGVSSLAESALQFGAEDAIVVEDSSLKEYRAEPYADVLSKICTDADVVLFPTSGRTRELAAMVVVDAVVRLLPGVLGSAASVREESHTDGLLEYPQYTRPEVYRDWTVPEVLLSGNHAQIARWRREQAILRTRKRRPELLEEASLNAEEKQFLRSLR